MKVTLSDSCAYVGLDEVNFPVEVEGKLLESGSFIIKGEELLSIGGEHESFDPSFPYWFSACSCAVGETMKHINWLQPEPELYDFLVDMWSKDLPYEDVKMYCMDLFNKHLLENEWELFDSLLFAQYKREMGELEWTEKKL